ncbi:MAG: outer membrane protein assembly factor BamE [Burkholderiales bacterium]
MKFALTLIVGLLAGCSYIPTIPGTTPYKMEIQQGNFITQEMISRLKPEMTREQVRFVLGTPLVADMFHADRWDYVYMRTPQGGGRSEQRRFTVYFVDAKLNRVEGDVVPQGLGTQAGGTKP